MAKKINALLAGGGTAGHVNPLLATAAQLRERGAQVLVLGTHEGLEDRLVPAAGFELRYIPKVPLPRKPSTDFLRLPGRLREAIDGAKAAIEENESDVVVGYGGYVSLPAYWAAKSMGVPVVIQEQNARPGIANKLGAKQAVALGLSFPDTPLQARHGVTEVTGMPLRAAITTLAHSRQDPIQRAQLRQQGAKELGLDPQLPTVLVTGGSLGALSLNRAVAQAYRDYQGQVQVLHLTGKGKSEQVLQLLEGADTTHYHVLEYLDGMEYAYAAADAVICRSGAGTVSELTAVGLPALYVPLPIGNGEQRLNAAAVVAAGGGKLVADDKLNASHIADLFNLTNNTRRLEVASHAAASCGNPDGTAKFVDLIESVVGE